MRFLLLVCTCLFGTMYVYGQISFENLTLKPEYPQVLQTITFTYNSKISSTVKSTDIVVYEFTNNGYRIKEPVITKMEGYYSGNVQVDTNANALLFEIFNRNIKDDNSGNGYLIPVFKNKEPVKGYYVSSAMLYTGYNGEILGKGPNPQKSLSLLETGIRAYPELIFSKGFYETYYDVTGSVDSSNLKNIIEEKLKVIENTPNLTENEYSIISIWYEKHQMQDKSDSLAVIIKQKYPNGEWVFNQMLGNFFIEKNLQKKESLYKSITTNGFDDGLDKLTRDGAGYSYSTRTLMKLEMAQMYDVEQNKKMFKKWSDSLPMDIKLNLYNGLSSYSAYKGEDLNEAKRMAKEAALYAKQQMLSPTEKKPENFSTRRWMNERKNRYGAYAKTYAYVLYKMGNFKGGLPYAKEASSVTECQNLEINEIFAMLAEKAMPPANAMHALENMVMQEMTTEKVWEIFKRLYIKYRKSEKGFYKYLSALETLGREKKIQAKKFGK